MGSEFYKLSSGEKLFKVINYAVIIVLCLSIILPFLNIVALAFNPGKDAEKGGIFFWPRMWSLDNFNHAFQTASIGTAFSVSLFRTVVGTAASVFLTAMAAYALKSKTLPGGKFFMM